MSMIDRMMNAISFEIVAALGVLRPIAETTADVPVSPGRAVLQERFTIRTVIKLRTRTRIGEHAIRLRTSIIRERDWRQEKQQN